MKIIDTNQISYKARVIVLPKKKQYSDFELESFKIPNKVHKSGLISRIMTKIIKSRLVTIIKDPS